MTQEQRRATITDALKRGDEQIVGAVLAGPAMLSGFAQPEEREEVRQMWQATVHHETVDRIDRLQRALVDAERADGLLLSYAVSLTDERIVAPAEASEREALRALRDIGPLPSFEATRSMVS